MALHLTKVNDTWFTSCSVAHRALSSSGKLEATLSKCDAEEHPPTTLHEPYLPCEGSAMMSLDGSPLPVPEYRSSSSGEARHRTAAEIASDAAERIVPMKAAEMFESRAQSEGFIAEANAAPLNVASGNQYTGLGTAAMAGMVDAVAGAFVGEPERVAKAVSGMTTGTPRATTHIQTPTQAWPRKSLQPDVAELQTDDTSVLEYCMKNRARGL